MKELSKAHSWRKMGREYHTEDIFMAYSRNASFLSAEEF
jgi:hypothetical protein